MKRGEYGQHLIDTGQWQLGSVDEEIREEVEKETDDQIRERIKWEEDFLEKEYLEFQDENQRGMQDDCIVDAITYVNYYMNVLEEREAFRQAMKIIVEGNPVNLSENPTVETKASNIDDTLKEVDK